MLFQRRNTIILVAFFLVACTRTELTSVVDPSVSPEQHYNSIAVFTVGMGLSERLASEKAMEEWLIQAKVNSIRGMLIAPPTQTYSESEIKARIYATGADAVLMLVLTSKDFVNYKMPTTYHSGQSSSYVSYVGNRAYVTTTQQPGYTTGGGTVRKPIASYRLSLTDVSTQKVVWIAEGQTGGGVQHSYADLAASTGRTAITKLITDGLIKKK